MKRILAVAGAVTAVLAAVRSWRTRRSDAELWEQATAPRDLR